MRTLSAEEIKKILIESNNTKFNFSLDKTITQLFEQQAQNFPTHIALLYEDQLLTYEELNAKANQFAHYLRKLKKESQNLIALCIDPSPELIIAVLAILKSGSAYLPLDPLYPVERLQFMLDDANVRLLISQLKYADLFKKTSADIIQLDKLDAQIAEQKISNLAHLNKPENLAYVIYTSGSTGKPKGAMLSHRNVVNFIHWFSQALAISPEDIVDFSSSIAFDFSVATTLFPICTGAKIAICPTNKRNDPTLYIEHLLRSKASIIKITPSRFRQIREFVTPEHLFDALNWLVLGGESCLTKDVAEWLKNFPHHKFLNEYGPTETTVATSWLQVDRTNIAQFGTLLPIGKPAANTQLYILNENLEQVPPGTIGELYIGGAGVGQGYLNRPELTAKRFIKNPFTNSSYHTLYKTGDLCQYLKDGNIEFVGRIDHQVKIRGFRVETAEIENYLSSHQCIKTAVVITQESKSGEIQLIAYYVLKNTQPIPTLRELRTYLQKFLPEYMIPSAFILLEALPLNPNGKLDREALPEPCIQPQQAYIAPQTKLEKTVQKIWTEVFNLENISIEDNFFELGGHSLAAARIISKIRNAINKEIKLDTFYSAPTICELSRVIQETEDLEKINSHEALLQDAPKKIPLGSMQLLLWMAQKFHSKSQSINIIDKRRLSGKINLAALNFAFACVMKKHPILCNRIPKYLPAQYTQKNVKFNINEKDFKSLPLERKEFELFTAFNSLKKFNDWEKDSALLKANLYYLDDETVELQIAISHLISDEISMKILLADLSNFYISYLNKLNLEIKAEKISYLNYVLTQNANYDAITKKAILYWTEYLKDANSVLFPTHLILKNTTADATSCTTHLALSETCLNRLKSFCAQNYLTITDCLCAAVSLALAPYVEENSTGGRKTLAISLVKSARDNEIYDQTIGFFVRNDIIKTHINDMSSFAGVSKEMHHTISKLAPHQLCPEIVKFAAMLKKDWKNKPISNFIIKIFSYMLAMLFYSFKLNPHILSMYGRGFLGSSDQLFVVEVNILNNFITNNQAENQHLFGMKVIKTKNYNCERMVAANVLGICFERDLQNRAYLIIAGNLQASLREKIGNHIIKRLNEI